MNKAKNWLTHHVQVSCTCQWQSAIMIKNNFIDLVIPKEFSYTFTLDTTLGQCLILKQKLEVTRTI